MNRNPVSQHPASITGLRTPGDPSPAPRGRSAFTLIELIAVMGIIVALALLVVGGYSGMSRAIAAGQGSRQVADSLLLARQTACVNGTRIYCYILDEDQYVLCRKMGTSCGNGGKSSYQKGSDPSFMDDAYVFYDYYTDLGSFVNDADSAAQSYVLTNTTSSASSGTTFASNALLFDLTLSAKTHEAKYGRLRGVRENTAVVGWSLYFRPSTGNDASRYFADGADYGIALFPIRALPKGFVFLEEDIGKYLYFEPTGLAGGELDEIVVAESALRNDPKHRQTVAISGEGKVEVKYPD